MPWHLESDNAQCSGWAVVKDSDGKVVGCHKTKKEAQAQLAALNINVKESVVSEREIRMVPADVARAAVADDGNTLEGYGAVTSSWAEIEGWEGPFKEQIAPGAFKRTITNNGDRVKVLFNHGQDPSIGSKPLGKPSVLREDSKGLWIEVPLDDTSYNADIKASLRSGAIDGMSFMFDVLDQEWNEERTERTIKEVRLYEVGPVTWPAYETTTVGIRSKGVYGGTAKPAAPGAPARSTAKAPTAPEESARDTSAWQAKRENTRKAFADWLKLGGEEE